MVRTMAAKSGAVINVEGVAVAAIIVLTLLGFFLFGFHLVLLA